MISIGLNIILGMLLVCGLLMGMRLDKRLRGLRQSHMDFAKAVQEMDRAALRTEASLADLRAGTELARSELAARIDQARLLTQRLDKLTADADRILEPALTLSKPLDRPSARPANRDEEAPPRAVRLLERKLAGRPEPVATPRSRVLVDDDLFEVGGGLDRRGPLAALAGGRR